MSEDVAGPVHEELRFPSALLQDVLAAYYRFLREQGAAAFALARWTKATKRSLEFVWLGGEQEDEQLALLGSRLRFGSDSTLFQSIKRMHTTAALNPYEREVLYGYPFVIGRRAGKSIRGPVLTLPVEIRPDRDGFIVEGSDEFLRFNALPFRPDDGSSALDYEISTLLEHPTPWPLGLDGLRGFTDALFRAFENLERSARLDGSLDAPPDEPSGSDFLRIIDQAAIFVAPRTNYFLASDLLEMSRGDPVQDTALVALLQGGGEEQGPEFSSEDLDGGTLVFPFPSNRAQRRVALLVQDETTQVVRVEGPPGTGKSLTIANLACHLAASGKSVLVTSQKDKALQVVDAKLRELGIPGFPITLLRRDADAKRELLNRLADVRKERGQAEVREELSRWHAELDSLNDSYVEASADYPIALEWEAIVEAAHRAAANAPGLRALLRRMHARKTLRQADRHAPDTSDEIAEDAGLVRRRLHQSAKSAVRASAELAVASATRAEKQHLNELAHLLKRNQRSAKNYPLFDRMKRDPVRARALLKLLPVWILAPDDVARLFPCEPGLFDVVIVDEASQVDLPSVLPVLHRAKKLVVSGDTRQMQPKRFAFVAQSLATQAWQPVRRHDHSLAELLDPTAMSLLELAEVMAQEENLLNEHFRSLPPIIDFSNQRWYGGRLRIMTDERRKRFGTPEQSVMQLHNVAEGAISNNYQENEGEARELVDFLAGIVTNPDYADCSVGVLCLFEEQIALLQDLIAETIEESEWEEHDLVVANPDGFQGDERDVILYSLSYDNERMPKAALSARQQDSKHVQGMLNVAFTRARDEVHVFHSAPIETFFKEDGKGAIGDWLQHIQGVGSRPRAAATGSRRGRIDSEFESEVAEALRARGIDVTHQYPACGYWIDLVCELEGGRVAVECDGEPWHTDEHGQPRIEDLERLAVLERAGWRVINIPYRKWLRAPGEQIQAVMDALQGIEDDEIDDGDGGEAAGSGYRGRSIAVTQEQGAIVQAVRTGPNGEDEVLKRASQLLGNKRLGKRIRMNLELSASELNHIGLLAVEEGEYFLTPLGREAQITPSLPSRIAPEARVARARPKRSRSTSVNRRTAKYGYCLCGGRLVLRTGRYGKFYGCSNYPRCHRTRSYR